MTLRGLVAFLTITRNTRPSCSRIRPSRCSSSASTESGSTRSGWFKICSINSIRIVGRFRKSHGHGRSDRKPYASLYQGRFISWCPIGSGALGKILDLQIVIGKADKYSNLTIKKIPCTFLSFSGKRTASRSTSTNLRFIPCSSQISRRSAGLRHCADRKGELYRLTCG